MTNNKYLENQILTASPEQLILITLEGAIRFLKLAKKEIEKEQESKTQSTFDPTTYQKRNEYLQRAQALVEELSNSIDPVMKEQHQFIKDLDNIYNSVIGYIIQVNAKKDAELCEKCIAILKELLDAWTQIVKGN